MSILVFIFFILVAIQHIWTAKRVTDLEEEVQNLRLDKALETVARDFNPEDLDDI